MFVRFITYLLCLLATISCVLTVYDIGWSNMALDFKVVISTIGGISFGVMTFLVLVSEATIIRLNHQRIVKDRSQGIGHRLS